jgi:hypothetical protein
VTRDVCHAGFYRVRRRAGIRSVPLSTQSARIMQRCPKPGVSTG